MVEKMNGSLGPKLAKGTIVVFLVVLLVAEILIYVPSTSGTLSVSVELTEVGESLTANISAYSSYAAHVAVTLYYTSRPSMPLNIYVYYDGAYPYSFSDKTNWFGVSQHLQAVGEARGIPVTVQVLNATRLASFLETPPTVNEVLLVQSGVLPDTVFTKSLNLVSPWVKEGGILVWSGDRIGVYSGVPGVPLEYPSPANPGNNGTAEFLNLSLLGGTNTSYPISSTNARDLGINFTSAIPGDTLNLAGLSGIGGTVLGNVESGFTNLASLPLGNGTIIYFGGATADASLLAQYIFSLLQSGAYSFAFEPFDYLPITLSPGVHQHLRISETLPQVPVGFPPSQVSVCSFAFQTDYQGLFARTTCL